VLRRPERPRRPSRDSAAVVASAVGFSFCLSLSAVALPLLALAEGYSAWA
jgi:hypothetical protein